MIDRNNLESSMTSYEKAQMEWLIRSMDTTAESMTDSLEYVATEMRIYSESYDGYSPRGNRICRFDQYKKVVFELTDGRKLAILLENDPDWLSMTPWPKRKPVVIEDDIQIASQDIEALL